MLLWFILGILSATIIYPLLEELLAIVLTGLEVIKGKWAFKVAEYNNAIAKIGDGSSAVQAIGFAIPETEDEIEDYDS